jgi:hypothetical protein
MVLSSDSLLGIRQTPDSWNLNLIEGPFISGKFLVA